MPWLYNGTCISRIPQLLCFPNSLPSRDTGLLQSGDGKTRFPNPCTQVYASLYYHLIPDARVGLPPVHPDSRWFNGTPNHGSPIRRFPTFHRRPAGVMSDRWPISSGSEGGDPSEVAQRRTPQYMCQTRKHTSKVGRTMASYFQQSAASWINIHPSAHVRVVTGVSVNLRFLLLNNKYLGSSDP